MFPPPVGGRKNIYRVFFICTPFYSAGSVGPMHLFSASGQQNSSPLCLERQRAVQTYLTEEIRKAILLNVEADDVFGHDPQVVYLRRVFSTCERMQKDLLEKLGISDSDVRLRKVRRIALDYFERLLSVAMRRGIIESEEDAGILYMHCFSRSLGMNNISVPTDIVSKNDRMSVVIKEVLG